MSIQKKTTRRRFLSVLLTVFLATILTVVSAVRASKIYYMGTYEDGTTSWISCGSSAGNTYWECPSNGGPCKSDPSMDAVANQFCNLPNE